MTKEEWLATENEMSGLLGKVDMKVDGYDVSLALGGAAMSLLVKLTLDDLDADQRQLAECIGMEAYRKLLKNYAGSRIRIRMPDKITIPLRNKEIKDKFNGYNYGKLAREYHLSENSVRKIVSSEIKRIKYAPLDGQISLFDKKCPENYGRRFL